MNITSSIASEIRNNQKEECATLVADAARKGTRQAVEDLVKTGFVDSQGFQANVIEKPDGLTEYVAQVVREAVKKRVIELNSSWREKDGVIYIKVISDGTTGPKWIGRLEGKGFRLSKWAKDVLNSKDFKPTIGIVYEIAILKGMLFEDNDRITKKIRAEAERRKFTKPNAEVACLIRENFSDADIEAMGLWWIIAMHEPIKDSDGDPRLLSAHRNVDGHWLHTFYDIPDSGWRREDGFAFVVSQAQSLVSAA